MNNFHFLRPVLCMRLLFGMALIVTASASASASASSDSLVLRDAIYIYNEQIKGNSDQILVGVDCDVFQVVVDVGAGFTNIAMGEGKTLSTILSATADYPDRINSEDAMFAFSLFKDEPVKVFVFKNVSNSTSEQIIGNATVFGYCYSTKPTARVFYQQRKMCTNLYSDGSTASCAAKETGVSEGTGAYGSLVLRDAMYLYGQEFNAKGDKVLIGENCDVFQLLLDVDDGYSDVAISQAVNESNAINNPASYPDRIHADAAMFSYALYSSDPVKSFTFRDAATKESTQLVGTGTAFGYCYSTNPNAKVYFREADSCQNKHPDGTATAIANCVVPLKQSPSVSCETPSSFNISNVSIRQSGDTVTAGYTVSVRKTGGHVDVNGVLSNGDGVSYGYGWNIFSSSSAKESSGSGGLGMPKYLEFFYKSIGEMNSSFNYPTYKCQTENLY